MSSHAFQRAWDIVKEFNRDTIEEELRNFSEQHNPFEFGFWDKEIHGKEQANKNILNVARTYGFNPSKTVGRGNVVDAWVKGPGSKKVQNHLKNEIRPGIAKFGTKIRPIVDWQFLMEKKGIPRTLWNQYAHETMGGMGNTSKTGSSTGLPTSACRIGDKKHCGTCYAAMAEHKDNVSISNWRHISKLGEDPMLHASAQAFLMRGHSPEFRGNWSGDYQNVEHVAQALSIAQSTPNVHHWLHTKEVPDLMKYLGQFEEYSEEWYNAIPQNVTMVFSQPYARMVAREEDSGGGLRSDEVSSKNSSWIKANNYANENNPNRHPNLKSSEVGTAPREGATLCPTSLRDKDPETGKNMGNCGDFNCSACRNNDGKIVQYGGHHGGFPNINMPNKDGDRERAMDSNQLAQQQKKALAQAMLFREKSKNWKL